MKNFKFTFIFALLMFLDVAVLPRVCTPKQTYTEKILLIFEATNTNEVIFGQLSPIETTLRIGDTFTQEEFNELFDYFLDLKKVYYIDRDNFNEISYDIVLNSYSINNITLCGNQHDFKEIKLPYQIKEDDFAVYYQGNRNILVFKVSLDIDYTLLEKGV